MKLQFLKFSKKHFSIHTADVCIIGGGPVGMTVSALLAQKNIKSIILEKDAGISNHPKAHYISPRTVEILNYIGFKDYIEKYKGESAKDYNNWRYYRYCQYLLDRNSYYGEIDHFEKDKTLTMQEIKDISNSEPLHIGQNKINRALFDYLNEKYMENKEKAGNLVQFRFNSEFVKSEKLDKNALIIETKGSNTENCFYEVQYKEKNPNSIADSENGSKSIT